MAQTSADWQAFFQEWPKDLAQTGVIVSQFDEQIEFVGFLTSDQFLLIERRVPDVVGGRRVIIPFDQIAALKVIEPVKSSVFTAAGFRGQLPR